MSLQRTDDVDRAARTLYRAFRGSAANDYLTRKFFNLPMSEPMSQARINACQHYLAAFYYDHGAEVVEANDFNAVAIWVPPNKPISMPKTNDPKFNKVFFDDISEVEKRVIPQGMKFFYLFIIGRDLTDNKTRGSVRAIFNHYTRRADKENVAICLEAISAEARNVYEYFGFKTYLEFQFGAGEVDSKGNADPNGKGFTGYLMIYLPNTHQQAQL